MTTTYEKLMARRQAVARRKSRIISTLPELPDGLEWRVAMNEDINAVSVDRIGDETVHGAVRCVEGSKRWGVCIRIKYAMEDGGARHDTRDAAAADLAESLRQMMADSGK